MEKVLFKDQHLAKKDENGNICGIWGVMSDFSHSFDPWEDFRKGLYLAGADLLVRRQGKAIGFFQLESCKRIPR